MSKRIAVLAALAFAAACGAPQTPPEAAAPVAARAAQALTIENARVRAPAGGQTITAGFLTVRGGPEADRLLAASSPNAESIEIHTVREEGGMMQMIKVDALEVPAGGALDLQPGGNHLMLFGYVAPADGAATPVTLTFEKAGAVDAMLALDTTAAPGGHGGGH